MNYCVGCPCCVVQCSACWMSRASSRCAPLYGPKMPGQSVPCKGSKKLYGGIVAGQRGQTPCAMHCMICSLMRILRSEEHTSELQSRGHIVCRLLLEKKKSL